MGGGTGTVWDMTDGDIRVAGQHAIGFVYVDGTTVGEVDESDLKDRRTLAEEGFVSIFVALEPNSGEISSSAPRSTHADSLRNQTRSSRRSSRRSSLP